MATEQKFQIPTEVIDLPSKGLIYEKENVLSSGQVEMKYMTAKEEDILTNINLLRQGTAIEKTLKSLIVSPIGYDDLLLGDRNGLLIAARILAYGKDYTFKYTNPNTGEVEDVLVDLQNLKYKQIDESLYAHKNEFTYTLPYSKNQVTFKLLTVGDDKKIDEEIKGIKKALNQDAGSISTRLKYQLTSVSGDYSVKAVREFIDKGYLLSRDSMELRQYISKITPDIDTKVGVTLKDGEELTIDMPMTAQFFFPGSDL
jgi:hypothetical protein